MTQKITRYFTLIALLTMPLTAISQEDSVESNNIEEITVTGSQIKGAKITGALPVSVLDFQDVEALGVDSGDELLENVVENGMNFFNEAENASGGVNSSRGDVGAYNLRNMGVGNTLTLLNGRRMVNSPGYQTELLGGDYVPTVSVNTNLVPVWGIDRLEILRDGASAIYGADAVSGVVNNVLQTDYEGFQFRTKMGWYEHFGANDKTFTAKWGTNFNDDKGNVSVFVDFYDRDNINSSEDPRWGNGDHRMWTTCDLPDGVEAEGRCLEDGNPWSNNSSFRNNSANSLYGQFDMVTSKEHGSSNPLNHVFTDSNGEFEGFPLGDPRCSNRSSQGGQVFDTGYGTCIAQDGNGTERYNLWGNTDVRSDMRRSNIFVYINNELANGLESFTEIGFYNSDSFLIRHPSYAFSSVKHRVGADNYYLNQMSFTDADGNTLDFKGYQLYIDNYRYAERMRHVNVDKQTYRLLQGFRGEVDDWDWEAALLYSKATSDDVTSNRVSNTLLKEALNDPTPAAYNPFSAGVNSNVERILVDVYRKGSSSLSMMDFKVSNGNFMDLSAGPMGVMFGIEVRREQIVDDRDPRLDGTITYVDYENDTYPEIGDVVNSSPTGDVSGERNTLSLFTEAQIPLAENVNAQLALRYENMSDVEDSLVSKLAIGWEISDSVLFRASASTSFRAPNIVQINEKIVVRSGTRYDWAMYRLEQLAGLDSDDLDSRSSQQRQATGADGLLPEESDNYSVGFVITPANIDGLTITADYWSIDKENTIGLFGRENHTVQDMLLRIANGNNNCDTFGGHGVIERSAPDADQIAAANAAGICPFGNVNYVADNYLNLADRKIEGFDLGVYYNFDTDVGDFSIRYIGSFIDTFEQEPGGVFADMAARKANGDIPADIPLGGFGDLLLMDGNYDNKHTFRASYRSGPFGANLTALKKGEFYQNSLTRPDGTKFMIDSMMTMDLSFDYRFDLDTPGVTARVRFAIKNFTDERAPLADRYYGYFADAHQDYGRNYYLDLNVKF